MARPEPDFVATATLTELNLDVHTRWSSRFQMVVLTFGERLAIVFPTFLFFVSTIFRYSLQQKTRKEMTGSQIGQVTHPGTQLGPAFPFVGAVSQVDKHYWWNFYIDSIALSIANGLIMMFVLIRPEWGAILLVLGVIISLGGMVATEVGTANTNAVPAGVAFVFFVSEFVYFLLFGIAVNVLSYTLYPRIIALIPTIVMVVLVIAVVFYQRTKRR